MTPKRARLRLIPSKTTGAKRRRTRAAEHGIYKRGIYEDELSIDNLFRYSIVDSRGECIRVVEVPANRGGDALEAELWEFLDDVDPIAPLQLL